MKPKVKNDVNLVNADIYRLLANCFDFPSGERLFAIREISGALSEAGYPDAEIESMISTLNASIDEEEILHDYSVIFIKGGVPLSESHITRKYNSVSDVSAYYNAFGFSPRSGDTPDAIMYELEFLALLSLKSVIAPNKEAASVTEQAYKDFLKEHAADFSIALAQRIREGKAGAYFFTVSYLLEAFIKLEMSKI